MRFTTNAISFLALAVALSSVVAQGTTIVKPTSVTFSTEIVTREAVQTINASGLSSDLITGAPLPGVYPTHNTDATGMWVSTPGDTAPYIVFNLGAQYDLSGFHVWNFNQPGFTDVGVRNVTVSFSNVSAVAGFGSPEVFSGADEFGQGPALSSYVGQDKSFDFTHTAQWVRFDINSNWGNGTYFAGISEVRFFSEPIVPAPEPTSLALLGLGLAVMVRRTRRRN